VSYVMQIYQNQRRIRSVSLSVPFESQPYLKSMPMRLQAAPRSAQLCQLNKRNRLQSSLLIFQLRF